MHRLHKLLLMGFIIAGLSTECQPQGLKSSLFDMIQNGYSEMVFKQYLSPLSKAFGTNLSSGISSSARVKQFPHVGLTINVLSTAIPEDQRYFIVEDGLKYPTVFGARTNDNQHPEGILHDELQFPVAQLHLGLFSYLEFIFRYTDWEIEHLGHITLTGFGIKYELIDINLGFNHPFVFSLMAYYHNLQLDEYIESGSFGMTFVISRKLEFVPIEMLAGIRYTNNIMTIETTHINVSSGLGSINIEGLNGLMYNFGLAYKILFIRLHADYNIGTYQAFTGGITIDF